MKKNHHSNIIKAILSIRGVKSAVAEKINHRKAKTYITEVTLDSGRTFKIHSSVTPTNYEHALKAAVRDVKFYIEGIY